MVLSGIISETSCCTAAWAPALSTKSRPRFATTTMHARQHCAGAFLQRRRQRRFSRSAAVNLRTPIVVAAPENSKQKLELLSEPNPASAILDTVVFAPYLNALSASLRSPCSARLLSSPEILYFAFGSNLNRRVLRGLRGITPLSQEPAVLKQYRLAFNMLSMSLLETSFASVEPSTARDEVHGVLYRLTRSQFLSLCLSEGVPLLYKLEEVKVHPYEGAQATAFTLRTSEGPWRSPWGLDVPPSRRYMGLIREGARESGLKEEWLAHLNGLRTSLF